MKNERKLKNIDVRFISLVKKGANKKSIFFKSEDGNDCPVLKEEYCSPSKSQSLSYQKQSEFPSSSAATDDTSLFNFSEGVKFEKRFEIKKINEEERIVIGIVYSPGEVDAHGDFTDKDTIKEMAYSFMKHARTNNVDIHHNYETGFGYIAESWIVKNNDPLFPDEIPGSWAIVIKVENEDVWEMVKSGEISGISMAGFAEAEEMPAPNISEDNSQINKNIPDNKNEVAGLRKEIDDLKTLISKLENYSASSNQVLSNKNNNSIWL